MKKRGFTLIELLGVIVVLGLLATTVTFIIFNTVEDSKKKAALRSAEQLIKAVTLNYTEKDEFTTDIMDITNIDYYNGKKPESGYIQFNDKENPRLYMVYNGYCVTKFYDSELEATKMNENDICDWYTRNDTIREETNIDNPQLVLNNLKESQILDYKIYGNTKQETSTASANLVPDIKDSAWSFTGNARVDGDYIVIPDAGSVATITIKWNGQTADSNGKYPIYFGYSVLSELADNKVMMGWSYLDENKATITTNGYSSPSPLAANTEIWNVQGYTTWDENHISGNAVKNAKYIRLSFKYDAKYCIGPYKIRNVMVSKSPITDFVIHSVDSPSPDYPSEVVSLGESGSIDLVNSSKNLLPSYTEPTFTNAGVTYTNNNDGTITISGTPTGYSTVRLFNNAPDNLKYILKRSLCTLSLNVQSKVNITATIIFYKDKKSVKQIDYSYLYDKSKDNIQIDARDLDFDDIAIYIKRSSNNILIDNVLVKPQLEIGSAATSYEPYQEPITNTINLTGHDPLRKIGDIADYIDYENGRIVRNIGKIVFNGTEGWGIESTQNFYTASIISDAVQRQLVVSTHSLSSDYIIIKPMGNIFISASQRVNFSTSLVEHTGEAMKRFALDQYNNGTPLTVYYKLAEPTYESIVLPSINTFDGYNNIYVTDGNLNSSKISIVATRKSE